ncbi:MICAL-like protein 1 [Papilio machaon]|uniref:MICAL-like protein 1 n=1 Tax=Papilio machaon TaxID=76193 RepID=A0A194QRG3_PAPMA|nr:MICAL-like protein 1 [Papilio machaon]
MSEVKGTKALELWCKRLVKDCPNIQIDNMTTSWRNGMAFCALVHHFRPDLIDLSKLKPENIYENNQLAFSIAEKHLGIPALLDPEDMVENDVPDRLSVLTYLSQFYQRLSHTVNTKATEGEPKVSSPTTKHPVTPIRFGKTGLDKCAACGLPVYLAQRLMVDHKLYHRRCFRCSKCSGHLNPKNYQVDDTSEFCCDACKNEKNFNSTKIFNNNDQMGMLAYSGDASDSKTDPCNEEQVSQRLKTRPQSVLDKISMFEKNVEKDTSIDHKLANISLKDSTKDKLKVDKSLDIENSSKDQVFSSKVENMELNKSINLNDDVISFNESFYKKVPDNIYKSNINKFNFLQTQLSEDNVITETASNSSEHVKDKPKQEDINLTTANRSSIYDDILSNKLEEPKEESNITDDSRLAKSNLNVSNSNTSAMLESKNSVKDDSEKSISVPPRRKKHNTSIDKATNGVKKEVPNKTIVKNQEYPDYLNPFSDDDEDEKVTPIEEPKRVSTNPFGSSEDEDEVPTVQIPQNKELQTPIKRHVIAQNPSNPFWSDGEEPSSDEETYQRSSNLYKSSMATSTPNLPSSTPRRKKPKAPAPPPTITISEAQKADRNSMSVSMDDVASISSLSSHTSTVYSDQCVYGDKRSYLSGSNLYKSSMATSTPNLPSSTPRRKKPKAPAPPPTITISEAQKADRNSMSVSMDDVASISSLSSHTSTVYSDQKSIGTITPKSKKKRHAPTPPDSLSTLSGCGAESMEKGVDTSGTRSGASDEVSAVGRRVKGPAPGLPLPARRAVRLQLSGEELQVQLDLLETQQLGLERQGVLIEQMIRDKCEGDEAVSVPQEEIEDLVIQLCELVNEKNDLFRKQTELMYIRRQQRLEQEQADIEHEIRIIQSRPAVNRIDSDKAREEELVTRLVEIVRLRDELVQQIEAERRRERQEDLAIAASIATKRAQRNSDSNASSIKSTETIVSPKKNKVKDKVKKQLKKAKHTLISKKKDEDKLEKEKKPK